MKKFLVLTFVLGMASLASAGFVITTDGTTALDPDDILAPDSMLLGIASDADMSAFESHTLAIIVNDAAATITGGVPLTIVGFVSTIPGDVQTNPTILNPDGTNGIWMTTLSITGTTAQDLFCGIVLTCVAQNVDAVVGLYEILEGVPFGNPLATLVIPQIPEPMTIALLGLGGLFLRRRK